MSQGLAKEHENAKMLRHNTSQSKCWLARIGNRGENQTLKQCTDNIALVHRHTETFYSGEKMKICQNHQTFEVAG